MGEVPGFQELLARARAGDSAATDELLRLIRPWLEDLTRNHAPAPRPAGGSSDLVQEAWLRAWQRLDQFQGHADEAQALAMFRAWLARLVSRLHLNAARDGQARRRSPPGKLLRLDDAGPAAPGDSAPALDPSAPDPTPSARAQADEQARRLREALAQLPDARDREIVQQRCVQGLSFRQIADRLGCTHEAVRKRYHAALARLQQDLRGLL